MSTKTAYSCSFRATARKLNRVKINDLLEKANNSNEMKISSSIPKFRTDLKAPDIMPQREMESEDDYIATLKINLESMVDEDPQLLEYYNGLQTRLNQKKIDEIYQIVSADIPISTLKRPSLKTGNGKTDTKVFNLKENKHLKKKTSSSPKFVQETLMGTEETESVSNSTELVTCTEDDFDNISEKIRSGEIKIDSENSVEADQSQLTFDLVDETREKEKKAENDDMNLKIAFDMISEEEVSDSEEEDSQTISENIFSKLFKYRSNTYIEEDTVSESDENEEYNGFEYESINDKPEAERLLSRAISKNLKSLLFSLGVLLLTIFFKIATGPSGIFAEYSSYQKYIIGNILFELQLIFASVAIHKSSFFKGLVSFTTGKFSSDSIFTVTAILTTVHSLISLFNCHEDVKLYGIIPVLMSSFMALNSYLRSKKDLNCFNVVSKECEKYTASELSPTSKEASNFYSYLSEDSDVYTVSKTRFVSSFFKRISKRPKSEDILNAIIPGVIFISAIIFAVCFFHGKMNLYDSFTSSIAFIATAMPATSFFIISLPLISANKSCKKFDSAIIGDCVAEEYSNASVISFQDTELFPPSKVVMTNMKVYHNMRIDQIIIELARIFDHLEGPLKDLFANAVDGIFESHNVIQVIESAENGIMIAADGVDYYLGNGDFIRSHSLDYEDDPDDLAFEKNGGSVMIFAANKIVAAKFYFRYTPQKGFKKLLSHMYKCGLCIGIKTLDPNINNNLLAYYADGCHCPISILKSSEPEELKSEKECVDSGIISNRSLGAFLKAFMLCDKARHSIKSNGIVMFSGVILTALVMLFISITGGIADFSWTYAVFLQSLWTVVVFILSLLG